MMQFKDFLEKIGVSKGQNIIVHSSLRSINIAFNRISPNQVIDELKLAVTEHGSLIMPVFTYNFKKSNDGYERFDAIHSTSKTGALTEVFRNCDDVNRTSSPTHSFAIWGKIKNEIKESNSPESPLGENSVLHWLAKNNNSFVLLLGTNFSSLSLIHYYEILFKVPWHNYSPWDYMNVLPIGVNQLNEQNLIELPGCSKSFTSFESYLIEKYFVQNNFYKGMKYYFIDINKLTLEAEIFFKNNYKELLCKEGTCQACDSRRRKYLND